MRHSGHFSTSINRRGGGGRVGFLPAPRLPGQAAHPTQTLLGLTGTGTICWGQGACCLQ